MSAQRRLSLGGTDVGDEPPGKRVRSRWRLVLGQVIGPAECPLMRRWFVETPRGSLRLHHFLRDDDGRHLHDHPWWFVTIVLAGGYEDVSACGRCCGTGAVYVDRLGQEWAVSPPEGADACPGCGGSGRKVDRLRAGSVRFRPAEHRHAVRTRGCWTLVVGGPERRLWGFWIGGDEGGDAWRGPLARFLPMSEYFSRFGHAPCED